MTNTFSKDSEKTVLGYFGNSIIIQAPYKHTLTYSSTSEVREVRPMWNVSFGLDSVNGAGNHCHVMIYKKEKSINVF